MRAIKEIQNDLEIAYVEWDKARARRDVLEAAARVAMAQASQAEKKMTRAAAVRKVKLAAVEKVAARAVARDAATRKARAVAKKAEREARIMENEAGNAARAANKLVSVALELAPKTGKARKRVEALRDELAAARKARR